MMMMMWDDDDDDDDVLQVVVPEAGDVDGPELSSVPVPGLVQHQAGQQVVVITSS